MKINKEKFYKDIFQTRFSGNYSKCAHALNIEPQQLHRFINQSNSEAGAKLLGGFFAYCENEKLDFKKYIFLPGNSTAVYHPTGTSG